MAKGTSENGYIDLGRKYDSSAVMPEKPKERVDYPTLFISHKSGGEGAKMDDMPDSGEAVIKYKVRSYKEDLENGTCSCELDVISIKPMGAKEKKKSSSEDSLDEAFNKIASKKK